MGTALGAIDIVGDPAGTIDSPTGIIAAGGAVWFTSISNGRIGRVRPGDAGQGDGTGGGWAVETFADPHGRIRLPANLYPAADGRLWITCLGSDALASLDPAAPDPAATIHTVTHPDLCGPVAIKSAPDGLLWCSVRGSDAIASLDPLASDPAAKDPAATIRLHRSHLIDDPSALFVDARGLVWWVNAGTGTVGRLDPSAPDPARTVVRLGPWPGYGAPRAWAADASGTLWVTAQDPPGLLAIGPAPQRDAAGDVSVRRHTHPMLRTPDGVWVAADGAVWLADTAADAIVRLVPASEPAADRWSTFSAPGVAGPFDIKAGPDPAYFWFTAKRDGSIGRIRVSE
ncbi:hypothetical protein [Tomitella fengzijianii]|uniref:Virginiamycin B lyase n=1 Tax=Tomitella fengzijianii TaxID=2597660 RepID=A0A516X3E0_9ACTN|nr:hypothetical protein [Tomitella fengzijianii]QDQ97533.1 hypothetical protein FO059_09575 [Tomitella fengzijianii]